MRLNKLTLGSRIAGTTGLLVFALILMAWYGLHAIGVINGSFEVTANRTARKALLIGDLGQAISDLAAGERGVLAFGYAKQPQLLAASRQLFRSSVSRVHSDVAEITPLLVTEEGRSRIDDINSRLVQWLPAYDDMERMVEAGELDGAVKLLSERITPHYQGVAEDCRRLMALVDQVLQNNRNTVQGQHARAQWLMILLMAGGVLAAGAALWVARSASGQLRHFASEMLEGSRQVAAAAGQVAAASQSLAQGTSQQAATLEETSSSTAEITSITRKNSENTRTVAGLMDQTARLVRAANHNLEEMILSMKEINGSSEKISKIIKVIDEIAFQTNILALNAAVEAARAGEAGLGFAVVADEVRNLAHRSAQAAKDTAALIEESILKSGAGSKKLDDVAKSIREITTSATQVKTLIDEVDTGSQEQARGIEQIAMAVGQMEQVTQRSAAGAEESAAASEELAAQAQALHAIVERLRGLVGGASVEAGARVVTHGAGAAAHSSLPSSSLAALGNALRGPDAKPKAQALIQSHALFPLDEQESDF